MTARSRHRAGILAKPGEPQISTPQFIGAGPIDGTAANADYYVHPEFPLGWQPGDIAILLTHANLYRTWSDPTTATWNQLSFFSDGSDYASEVWWKRLEVGDVAPNPATFDTERGHFGRIFGYRGCTEIGSPIDGITAAGDFDSEYISKGIELTGPNRLVSVILSISDDIPEPSILSPWTDDGSYLASTIGVDFSCLSVSQQVEEATDIDDSTVFIAGGSDYYSSFTFGLIPA